MIIPAYSIQGLSNLNDLSFANEIGTRQLQTEEEWPAYPSETRPLIFGIVTTDAEEDEYIVKVREVQLQPADPETENPDASEYGTEDIEAFNLGGFAMKEKSLIIGHWFSSSLGKPYLGGLPMPQRGTVESSSALAGEDDQWEYQIGTAAGTVEGVTNLREKGNTSTNYQGIARSLFPSFTVKPIADDERVQLMGAYIDIPNLVVCDA